MYGEGRGTSARISRVGRKALRASCEMEYARTRSEGDKRNKCVVCFFYARSPPCEKKDRMLEKAMLVVMEQWPPRQDCILLLCIIGWWPLRVIAPYEACSILHSN